MKTTCLTWIAAYLLLALGLAGWFFQAFPPFPTLPPTLPDSTFRIKAALAAGFLDALPALFAVSMLQTARLRLAERRQLGRAAEGGQLVDGARGAFFGAIHRDGPPLTAPLSRRDCLLYRYQISHIETEKKSRPLTSASKVDTTNTIVDAEGFALTPSAIQTAGGPVKLLTLVKPEFKADRFTPAEVTANYHAYVAGATLMGVGSLDADANLLRTILEKTDGAIRYDMGTGTLDPSAPLLIKEHIVQHGDTVVVFGKYSAERGGIVHDTDSVWETRLRKGSLESLRGGLLRGAVGRLAGAAAWCAASALGAWVFFRFGPTAFWG